MEIMNHKTITPPLTCSDCGKESRYTLYRIVLGEDTRYGKKKAKI